MERRSLDHWEAMAWLLPAIGVLLALMPTNDLAYLIRVGDHMTTTGQIARQDFLTYTVAGQDWVNQQWLAAGIFGWLHGLVGWPGLVIIRAALVSLCFGLTYRRTRGAGADPMVAGCLVVGGFVCAAVLPGAIALRPQLLVAPLFVLTAWLLARRTDHPNGLWAIVPISIAWANLHGSFVLLPVLMGIAFLGDLAGWRRLAWVTGGLTALTLATPMVTPWGPGMYGYLVDLVTSPIVRVIDEWRPVAVRWPAGPVFFLACVGIVVALWRRRSRRPSVEETIGLVVFTALAAGSGRNLLWWSLYVPPVVGGLLAGWRPASTTSRRASAAIVAALVALALVGVVRVASAPRDEALLADTPAGVTSALGPISGRGRIFAVDWGGWFEYALPGVPMFVDARAEVFPGYIWDQYFDVVTADAAWRDVLDRWDVHTVVLDPSQHPALDEAIAADPDWELVYRDDDGVIYGRAPG